jgi:hypothetical protein
LLVLRNLIILAKKSPKQMLEAFKYFKMLN